MRLYSRPSPTRACALCESPAGYPTMRPAALLPLAFAVWTSFGLAQTSPQPPAAAQLWRASQETNAADAYSYTRFTLLGKFTASPHADAANRPSLAVDCIPATRSDHAKGKFLSARLQVGTPLKILWVEPEEAHGISYFPRVAVQYRAGDADEQDQWSAGTDKTSVSIPKGALKKILRAHTVTITALDEHGSKVPMQFDIADPTTVEQGCNVDER